MLTRSKVWVGLHNAQKEFCTKYCCFPAFSFSVIDTKCRSFPVKGIIFFCEVKVREKPAMGAIFPHCQIYKKKSENSAILGIWWVRRLFTYTYDLILDWERKPDVKLYLGYYVALIEGKKEGSTICFLKAAPSLSCQLHSFASTNALDVRNAFDVNQWQL